MLRVTQVDSEEELEKFSVWNVLFSFLRGKLNDTSIDVDLYSNKTCLKVELLEPGTTYSVALFRRTSPPQCDKGGLGLPGAAHDPRTCSFLRKGIWSVEGIWGVWKLWMLPRALSLLTLWQVGASHRAPLHWDSFYFQALIPSCSLFPSWACCCFSVGTP